MIYLIKPYIDRNKFGILNYWDVPSLALGYLAAVLEKNNIKVKIIDADILRLNERDLFKIIKKVPPTIIGLTGNVFTAKYSIYTALKLKKEFGNANIIFGGPYATIEYEFLLNNNIAEIVVLGEGEKTFLELIKALQSGEDLKNTKGIAYKKDKKIIVNPLRENIQNLDDLPFPAWHLFPNIKKYKNLRGVTNKPYLPLMTSRGCPYSCIWCTKCIHGKKLRYRSAENVFAEIRYFVEKYDVKEFIVMDDTFTQNRVRVLKLCFLLRNYRKKIVLNLYNGVRADKLDDFLIKALKSVGVNRITLGIESGNQMVLNRIKKSLDLKDVIKSLDLIKKNHLISDIFIMLGLPFDTKKTVNGTIRFTRSLNPDHAYYFLTIPYRGTELYEIVKNHGTFLEEYQIGILNQINDGKVLYEINDLKKDFLEKKFSEAYKTFYLRPLKILSLLKLYFEFVLKFRSLTQIKWLFNEVLALLVKFKIFQKILK